MRFGETGGSEADIFSIGSTKIFSACANFLCKLRRAQPGSGTTALLNRSSFGLRNEDPEHGRKQKRSRRQRKRRWVAARRRKAAHCAWSKGAHDASEVVGKPLGGGSHLRGIELRGHGAETAEIAGGEKRRDRAERKKHPWVPGGRIRPDQRRGQNEVAHIGPPPANGVANEPKGDVTQPHPGLHGNHQQ